jgi:hypothetical protein
MEFGLPSTIRTCDLRLRSFEKTSRNNNINDDDKVLGFGVQQAPGSVT